MVKRRTCVFISGQGTNLKNLISHSRDNSFPLKISLVISNNKNANGIIYAKINKIPYLIINTENHNYEKPYHRLNALNQLRIIKTYLSDFIRNPDLINYSLFDTAISFIHYYILKTNYLEFYKFYEWDEQQIESTIKNNLDFEVYDKNIESSWRIGDLLSPLYNYIYFNYFGFTENDTLRSNQIRAQKISRKDALKLVKIENQPRIEPFIEFLDYLSLDGAEVIEKINMNNPYK